MLLIDRIGRQPLLWVGSVGMSVALVLMVVALPAAAQPARRLRSDGMGRLALVAANVYVVFFNMSWGPVMWVMLGEMFPNQIRGPALAVAGAAQWTSNFAITVTFPMLLAGIGLARAYGIYTVAAILSIFFVVRYVRETRGQAGADGRLTATGFGCVPLAPACPECEGQADLASDSFMVRADAAKRWSVVAAAGGKPSRVGGVTQGRTVGARMAPSSPMDGFTACPALGDPTGSSRLQGGAKATNRPQSLQSRKTEKPAQGGLFRFLLRRLALPGDSNPVLALRGPRLTARRRRNCVAAEAGNASICTSMPLGNPETSTGSANIISSATSPFSLRVIPRDQHTISRKDISPNALRVLYRLRDAGFGAYLSAARCAICAGQWPTKDFDVATDATPEQVKQLLKLPPDRPPVPPRPRSVRSRNHRSRHLPCQQR